MKRYNAEVQTKAGKYTPPNDPLFKGLKNLSPYLVDAFWDDGKPRETCTLTIRLSIEEVMVVLNDKENGMSVSTTAKSVEIALELMDGVMASQNPPWRKWKGFKR